MAEDRDQRTGGRQLFCRVITPEEVIYDGEADLVIARIADGDIGVLVDHSPLVSTVEAGEVRIRENDEQRVYATSDGFFKVSEDLVQVLVNAHQENLDAADLGFQLFLGRREFFQALVGAGGGLTLLEQFTQPAQNCLLITLGCIHQGRHAQHRGAEDAFSDGFHI